MEFLSLENSSLTEEDLMLTEIKQEIDNEVGDFLHFFQFLFLYSTVAVAASVAASFL